MTAYKWVTMSLLIIDIGSSSVRALLFDETGQIIPQAIARRAHRFYSGSHQASTADPLALAYLTEACIDEVLAHPQAAHIRAVGMATFAGNWLALAADGRPLTPLYTYSDAQPLGDLEDLRHEVDLAQSHDRTGCPHHTAYQPARLRWLQRTQAHIWSQAHRWCDLATFLYSRWFGREVAISYSLASWSGLLNRHELAWDDIWLNHIGLARTALPLLSEYDAWQTGLSDAYARRWSVLKDVPFALAIGDGAAANIGCGAVGPGLVALSAGTTCAIRLALPASHEAIPSGLWSYCVTADVSLIGGATTEGGNLFDWIQRTLAIDMNELETALLARQPDEHGLTFLPHLAGERSPGWSPSASGTMTGLRLHTTALDIAQAAMESVALRLGYIASQLPGEPALLIGSGGSLQSRAWAQMMSNACAVPLALADMPELTARGVALLLYHSLDHAPLRQPLKDYHILEPQPGAVRRYQQARHRQQALYERLNDD